MFTDEDVESTGGWSCSARPWSRTCSPARTPSGSPYASTAALFQVVGVTAAKGASGQQDQDDIALAPLTAVQDAITVTAAG